jgi:serine/threonine protein kinase
MNIIKLPILITIIFFSTSIFTAHIFSRTDNILKEYEWNDSSLIGEGGSCVVVKGVNITTNEEVAIKIVDLLFEEHVDYNEEVIFLRYIKLMGGHPNIINIIDSFYNKNDHKLYIVLELMEKCDLINYLEMHYDEQFILDFASQMVCALGFLEQLGIAHRDLKPDNILVSYVEKKIKFIIADFGLATFFNKIPYRRNYFCGSIRYIPPEGYKPEQDLTKRDYFALGVILYVMLNDKKFPWRGSSVESVSNAILNEDYEPLVCEGKSLTYQMLASYTHQLLSRDANKRNIENKSLNFIKDQKLEPILEITHLNIEAIKWLFYYHNQGKIRVDITDIIDSIVQSKEDYITRFYQFLSKSYFKSCMIEIKELQEKADQNHLSLVKFIQESWHPAQIKLNVIDN